MAKQKTKRLSDFEEFGLDKLVEESEKAVENPVVNDGIKLDPVQSAKDAEVNGHKIEGIEGGNTDEYYGRVMWYKFTEFVIEEDILLNLYRKLDVPEDIFPNEIRDKGAWKRACSRLQNKKRQRFEKDDEVHERKITYERKRPNPNTRIIVKIIRRSDEDDIEFKKLVRFKYEGEENISYEALDASEEVAKEWYDEMYQQYEIYRSHYTKDQIRDAFRDTLKTLNPVTITSRGSVYFIPEQYADVIEKFSRAIKILREDFLDIADDSSALEVGQLPVIKQPEQRDIIKRKIKSETVEDASKIMTKARNIIENDENIDSSTYTRFVDKMKELNQRRKEYEEILDASLNTCDEQMNILKNQLNKLAQNVKDD